MKEELQDSPQLFPIEHMYRIKNGYVVASRSNDKMSFLQPSEHSELPARLSDLHNCKEENIIDFTSEYGLLGYTEMYVDSISATQKRNFYNSHHEWGDRVDWIMSHSACINRIINLLELLRVGDSSGISDFLKEWKSETSTQLKDLGVSYLAGVSSKFFRVTRPDSKPSTEAWQTITNIINSNTTPYISEVLYYPENQSDPLFRSYKSKTLLPLIYRHLGDLALGLIQYYKCSYRKCSKRWTVNSDGRGPRNRYCPPKIGKESLCSKKERYERGKEKKVLIK